MLQRIPLANQGNIQENQQILREVNSELFYCAVRGLARVERKGSVLFQVKMLGALKHLHVCSYLNAFIEPASEDATGSGNEESSLELSSSIGEEAFSVA